MFMDVETGLKLLDSSPQLAVLGVLWYVAVKKIAKYDEHIEKCGEIPKQHILDELKGIGSWVEKVDGRLVKTEQQLNILVGRQQERDRK